MVSKPKPKPAFDAIDNYLPDDDDFDPFASPIQSPTQSPTRKNKRKEPDGGLGIEEAISVTKKAHVPRVKLDEARLLSNKGIPALRKRAAQLKLKGKGHEFSDAARLLSFYQLWLDDLFPKAKFLDALAMVEKIGHKTSMHKYRMDWINEGKPKATSVEDLEKPDKVDHDVSANDAVLPKEPTRLAPIFEKRQLEAGTSSGVPHDDDLFGEDGDLYNATPPRGVRLPLDVGASDVPDEDELDALAAEREAETGELPKSIASTTTASLTAPRRGLFESGSPGRGISIDDTTSTPVPAPDDDLEALMAEAEAECSVPAGRTAGNERRKSSAGPTVEDDDLDALMAEAESLTKPTTAGNPPSKPESGGLGGREFADDEVAMAELVGLW